MNSYSISNDLVLEILSRLPAKSVARFRCVSKQWTSIFNLPYFTELFLTKSSAKPRLLLAVVEDGVWSFFSLPQLHNPIYENNLSSTDLVVAAEFHVKFSQEDMRVDPYDWFIYGYASGLIYFYGNNNRWITKSTICNPNTGGYVTIPFLQCYRKDYSFFMFEPIDKQYKVLLMANPFSHDHHKIITLGTGDMKWRTIKCPWRHDIVSEGICINGFFYYLGENWNCDDGHDDDFIIVCFDVRSEIFIFIIGVKTFCQPMNYTGKLAVIYWEDDVKLYVWVLEDVEKPEWSKYAYTLSDDKFDVDDFFLAGATASGEIVFSMRKYSPKEPFYVFYFNPERNNLRRVEIQGFAKSPCSVYTFVDHVEDLNVNDPKLLKSYSDLDSE